MFMLHIPSAMGKDCGFTFLIDKVFMVAINFFLRWIYFDRVMRTGYFLKYLLFVFPESTHEFLDWFNTIRVIYCFYSIISPGRVHLVGIVQLLFKSSCSLNKFNFDLIISAAGDVTFDRDALLMRPAFMLAEATIANGLFLYEASMCPSKMSSIFFLPELVAIACVPTTAASKKTNACRMRKGKLLAMINLNLFQPLHCSRNTPLWLYRRG